MIDTVAIRKRILELAISGKFTEQNSDDEPASQLILKLCKEYNDGINEKILPEEIPFSLPEGWEWCRLSSISSTNIGLTYHPENVCADGIPVLRSNNIQNSKFDFDDLIKVNCKIRENQYINKNDILICARNGSKALVGKCAIYDGSLGDTSFGAFMAILRTPCFGYIYYYLLSDSFRRYFSNDDTKQINQVTQNILKQAVVPLPPLKEQERIVCKLEETYALLDTIDNLQSQYASDIEVLKSKLIDAGIQGKLTEQLPEDGNAQDLYDSIQEEKAKLIKEKKIKKEKPLAEITSDEIPFEIPNSWKWIRLGNLMDIERGGSPRPIKAYITDDENGINWIKIGDVAKDGKYIVQTHEKIKPEGEKKSRKVYPGDFLLTNSMSFGRPYISKIEGCIHDGWLLLRNTYEIFDLDYLYWLLSSKYAYNQFCKKASGATVDNLNKDKVADAIIPLPPLTEQRRIVEKLNHLIQSCEGLSDEKLRKTV